MDLIELRKLRRTAKKLQRLSIPLESMLNQLAESPSKQKEQRCVLRSRLLRALPKGPRSTKNLVQSVLLPTLKMQEADHESYKHGASNQSSRYYNTLLPFKILSQYLADGDLSSS